MMEIQSFCVTMAAASTPSLSVMIVIPVEMALMRKKERRPTALQVSTEKGNIPRRINFTILDASIYFHFFSK